MRYSHRERTIPINYKKGNNKNGKKKGFKSYTEKEERTTQAMVV